MQKSLGYRDLENADGISFLSDDQHELTTNIPNKDGIFIIVRHGNSFNMVDSSKKSVKPDDLAEIITSHPDYEEGDKIKLASCNTGADTGDDSDNYAQQLANAMPDTTIIAPTTVAQLSSTGKIEAEWKEFTENTVDLKNK